MAIEDKHKLIPKEIASSLYTPDNESPNNDSFRNVRLKGDPIQPLGLDNIAMWVSDALQTIDTIIDTINKDKIGVSGSKGLMLYFSDDDVLGSASLQTLISAIPRLVLNNPDITNLSGDALSDYSIKKEKYAPLSILNAAIAKETIEADKLKGIIPVSKLSSPKAAAVICGTFDSQNPANCKWYEEDLENFEVITKLPSDNGAKGVSISALWDAFTGTFDGGKLDPASIDGSIAMMSNKTPLGTMKSTGTATSVVCGRTTDSEFKEVTINELEVISRTTGATTPSSQKLSTVFNNEAGTPFNGAKLSGGSVSPEALAPDPSRSFAWARVLGDGTVDNGYNVQNVTVNSAGKYTVRFTRAAPNAKYSISMNAFNDDGGAYINAANVYEGTQTTGQFDCWTKKSGVYNSTGFYVQVFST